MNADMPSRPFTHSALAERLSARLVEALTGPRLELLDDLLADDFSIYYGFTGNSLGKTEALAFFESYFPTVDLRYRDIRITPSTEGWVQQHIVDTDGEDGFRVRDLHVCMVVTLAGEKILHMAEYLDTAQTAGFDNARLSS
jgi:ketosteroid isomerase-like protein